jgi:hypothetical protein
MNKQLLLGFFIAIIACTSNQANMSQAVLQVKNKLEHASVSQKSAYLLTSSFIMSASQVASVKRLDRQSSQTPQETPTPTPTQPPDKKNLAPTHTPRPTSTPMVIPPSTNPNTSTLMILVSLIAVIVVVVGVWINRPEK